MKFRIACFVWGYFYHMMPSCHRCSSRPRRPYETNETMALHPKLRIAGVVISNHPVPPLAFAALTKQTRQWRYIRTSNRGGKTRRKRRRKLRNGNKVKLINVSHDDEPNGPSNGHLVPHTHVSVNSQACSFCIIAICTPSLHA